VFTGNRFAAEQAEPNMDFSQFISIDDEAIREMFNFDFADFDLGIADLDLAGAAPNLDFSSLNLQLPEFNIQLPDLTGFDFGSFEFDLTTLEIGELVDSVGGALSVPTEALMGIIVIVVQDYLTELEDSDFSDPGAVLAGFAEHLASPEVQEFIAAELALVVAESGVQDTIVESLQSFIQSAMQAYVAQVLYTLQSQIQHQIAQVIEHQLRDVMQTVMGSVAYQVGNQISTELETGLESVSRQMQIAINAALEDVGAQMADIDVSALSETFEVTMDEEMILSIMNSILNPIEQSFSRNLSILGYADLADPVQINIFPRSFDAKQAVTSILDNYNLRMEAAGTPEMVIRYTDLIGVMMSSVTSIIDMVSYGLVAFVAISLVVSSIMIGVITYISVLERKKEIGILRSIGASRGNIRSVFNAETLLIGFVAGSLGIVITLMIAAVGNAIVEARFDIARIAQLPPLAAVILVGVSMALTFIAGLIPSSAAARRDPVAALRSE
jgi:uncharacterized protein (DUF2267 family)